MTLQRISIDHQIVGGVPCVSGTRVPVAAWRSGERFPSVILLRRHSRLPHGQALIIQAILDGIVSDPAAGSFVVVTDSTLRVRQLPIPKDNRS